MADDKPTELPLQLDELDALAWENLQLKAEKAQSVFEAALVAFQAKGRELGIKYQFDPATARIDFATRKITRQ